MHGAAPNRTFTLVAMPPSGEVYIARDNDGTQWLIQPPGAGDPEPVTDEVVEQAVIDHGFDRIEQSFETWDELDAERQRRAGIGLTAMRVDVERFDAEDVRQMMRALRRCRQRGEILRARRVAHRLLRAPVILEDDVQYRALVQFLEELDAVPSPALLIPTNDEDSERAPARRRVLSLTA